MTSTISWIKEELVSRLFTVTWTWTFPKLYTRSDWALCLAGGNYLSSSVICRCFVCFAALFQINFGDDQAEVGVRMKKHAEDSQGRLAPGDDLRYESKAANEKFQNHFDEWESSLPGERKERFVRLVGSAVEQEAWVWIRQELTAGSEEGLGKILRRGERYLESGVKHRGG